MAFIRTLSCALTAASLIACGGVMSTADKDGGADSASDSFTPIDAGPAVDATLPPFDAGAFCSGSEPRLMINGDEASILSLSGKAIGLDCCDSAELTMGSWYSQAYQYLVWRAPVGIGSIDLGNPPQGFEIEMDLGCDPATTSCATATPSPEDRYTDGFSGTLRYAVDSGGLTVSYCVHVAESPSQPHLMIHSMALYAPNVHSPW